MKCRLWSVDLLRSLELWFLECEAVKFGTLDVVLWNLALWNM